MMLDRTHAGKRVELIRTDDPYTKLEAGSLGTVDFADSVGTLCVSWDEGSTLGLIVGQDEFRFVEDGK